MRKVKVVNTTKNICYGEEIQLAKSLSSRVKGLIGTKELPEGAGLLIPQCSSIHTFFMSVAIDVIFIDIEMRIIKIVRGLRKNKLCSGWNAAYVLELPVGTVKKCNSEIGDRVEFQKCKT